MTTSADLRSVAIAYKRCNPEEPLEPDDERWLDVDAMGVRGEESCVKLLSGRIGVANAGDGLAHVLFSGFQGSGKSTVLRQLRRDLEKDGFYVLYVDIEKYLNLQMPVETYEILLTIAGEIDDKYDWGTKPIERIWERITGVLNREIVAGKGELVVPAVGSLQLELKGNPDFRRELRKLLEGRQKQSAIIQQCRDFVTEVVARYREDHPTGKGLVLLLDNLDHLSSEERVRDSLIRVFHLFADELILPCHTVYTVPPWLRFIPAFNSIVGKFDGFHHLPMTRVIDPHTGKPHDNGIDALVKLLNKRMDVPVIFGSESPEILQLIARLSGGYMRDLLRLARGILLRIHMDAESLPLSLAKQKQYSDREIRLLAEQYGLAISEEDVESLVQIADTNDIPQQEIPLKRLVDLFDHHFVICYSNGGTWFDVHPLIVERSERYARLVELVKKKNGPKPG